MFVSTAPTDADPLGLPSGHYSYTHNGSDVHVDYGGPSSWLKVETTASGGREVTAFVDGDVFSVDTARRTVFVDSSGDLGNLVPDHPYLDPVFLDRLATGTLAPGTTVESSGRLAAQHGRVDVPSTVVLRRSDGSVERYEGTGFTASVGTEPRTYVEQLRAAGYAFIDVSELPSPRDELTPLRGHARAKSTGSPRRTSSSGSLRTTRIRRRRRRPDHDDGAHVEIGCSGESRGGRRGIRLYAIKRGWRPRIRTVR